MAARRKKTSKKAGTKPGKERILDAAERLFARHGFYGVSVRDITEAAGVDVALVSYHFGGKRELFAAVFQRRAEQLNPERLAMLEKVRRAALPGTPTVEEIVNAFTYPLLERSARGGPGWKSYFALVAQVNNSPEWGPVLMTQHFDPLVERFIAVLREALPGCAARDIYWGYQFLTGCADIDVRGDGAHRHGCRAACATRRISTASMSAWRRSSLRDFKRCALRERPQARSRRSIHDRTCCSASPTPRVEIGGEVARRHRPGPPGAGGGPARG